MPRGSMRKFFADRGGSEHGGKLHWPGTTDGYPFRGDQVPDLRENEFNDVPLALDFQSAHFKLWDPEDKRRFDAVMDRIVNGWYMQHQRKDIPVDGQDLPLVWLEWVQIYGEDTNAKHPGHTNRQPAANGSSQQITNGSTTGQASRIIRQSY